MGAALIKPDNTSAPIQADPLLTRMREEMELIAYVASHDLLAPLRIIDFAYSTLKEKRADSTDAEEKEALETINSETVRLRALLQGFLEYVRLDTFVPSQASLDANELINAAIESLGEEISATGATVTHDSLPQVKGHRGRLTRLFAQLIDNAIKFHGEQPPKVHVSVKRTGAAWTFCVEDNGIGIDPELQEAIFRLFQRLHTEAYPGYGIGLALSQKIVAAHGGKLWVESAPGKGSRFFFTLPADN